MTSIQVGSWPTFNSGPENYLDNMVHVAQSERRGDIFNKSQKIQTGGHIKISMSISFVSERERSKTWVEILDTVVNWYDEWHTPRVFDYPEIFACLWAVAHHQDGVVQSLGWARWLIIHPTTVQLERGVARINSRHHGLCVDG